MVKVDYSHLDQALKKMGASPDRRPLELARLYKESVILRELSEGITVEAKDFESIK